MPRDRRYPGGVGPDDPSPDVVYVVQRPIRWSSIELRDTLGRVVPLDLRAVCAGAGYAFLPVYADLDEALSAYPDAPIRAAVSADGPTARAALVSAGTEGEA